MKIIPTTLTITEAFFASVFSFYDIIRQHFFTKLAKISTVKLY
jgi:hypothetical protein